MKPIPSTLKILDFAIVNFDFSLVPGVEEKDVSEFFDKYDLDIDFDMFKNEKNEILQVRITAEVNRDDKPLPGYSIYAEAICIFEFAKDAKITQEERKNIEGFSTVYIALNSLRGLVSHFTANAPFGRYILPSIDLNDLVQKKMIIEKVKHQNSDEGKHQLKNEKDDIKVNEQNKKVKEKKKPS